jgi:hypothetical protein
MTPDPPPKGVDSGSNDPKVGNAVGVGDMSEVTSGEGVMLGVAVSACEGVGVGVHVEVNVGRMDTFVGGESVPAPRLGI